MNIIAGLFASVIAIEFLIKYAKTCHNLLLVTCLYKQSETVSGKTVYCNIIEEGRSIESFEVGFGKKENKKNKKFRDGGRDCAFHTR